ncbi:MAG: DUF4190 domain-containing protein [Byssovorax sp.]
MSQPLPPGPPGQDWTGKSPARHSSLAIAAFVISLIAFLFGLIPFFGFAGVLGIILGIVDRSRPDPPDRPQKHGLSTAGIVVGALASLGAIVWVVITIWFVVNPPRFSCPHVYANDGEGYRIDGDMVSGALFIGAERDDLDRMESLAAVDGEYKLRIQDDLDEIDHVDRFSLRVVDHAAGAEVLPTQKGDLVVVRDAVAPLRAVDSRGADMRALLSAADGRMVQGEMPARGEPRETFTLDFPRPKTRRALLIVRGHNTPFADEALSRYLSAMGQGLGPVMEEAQPEPCPCFQAYLDEEVARLGLPLTVEVRDGEAWSSAPSIQPVGPAVLRSQALPIELPAGGDQVSIRLGATPLFWEIDQVELAPVSDEQVAPVELSPRVATRSSGEDVTALLTEGDGRRLVLTPGDRVDVRFPAPPLPPGRERTIVASMRGHYTMNVGGRPGLNPVPIVEHRLGWRSLPRLARDLAQGRSAR